MKLVEKLVDMIPIGAENAISKVALIEATGLRDRELRLRVAYERRRGELILTDCSNGGYFRPVSTADTLRFIQSMRHRAKETNLIADAIEASLLNEVGQMQLGGW